jgi:hypothetical protein
MNFNLNSKDIIRESFILTGEIQDKDLINKLKEYKKLGVNVIKTSGHEMVSENYPIYDGRLLPEIVKIGSKKMPNLSKSIIFKPDMDMNFDVGAHSFTSNDVIISENDDIKILHYKFLGKEYVTENYKKRLERLSQVNKNRKWGIHYSEINKVYLMIDEILKSENEVI